MRSILILYLLLGLMTQVGFAQHRFGTIPQISTNFKVGDYMKVNTKLENRFILYQNPLGDQTGRSRYERSDLEVILTGRKGALINFGAGYLIRRNARDGSFTHRAIQQFSTSGTLGGLLLAHRFRTDQTFDQEKPVKYRLRYRLSMEVPLNGQQVDYKEFYLKFNNEYLGALEDSKGNLEIRFLSALGFNSTEKDQIEIGLDYRIESLIQDAPEHLLWLNLGWYHSF